MQPARNLELFEALGFSWKSEEIPPNVPRHSIERASFRFHKMLATFVWEASSLEGNPLTFAEVQTIIAGVTVGGRRISDQAQVVNLVEGSRRLLSMVCDGSFSLGTPVACELHAFLTRREDPRPGHFRDESAGKVFEAGVNALVSKIESAYERACACFLFGASQQFFAIGNERTSRFMMNGTLMAGGIDAISIPASRAEEFSEKMASFRVTRDGSEMMAMLWSCHPASTAAAAASASQVGSPESTSSPGTRPTRL